MIKTNLFVLRTGIIFISYIFLFIQTALGVANDPQITILEKKGEIYQQLNEDFESLGEDLIEFQRIRVGELMENSSFSENPQKVQEHWSVFQLNSQMTMVLSNGSVFQLNPEEDNLFQNLQLEGIAHIFLVSEKEDQPVAIRINDTLIQSPKSYLYFNGSSQSFNLVVISGEITLPGISTGQSDQTSDTDSENHILLENGAGFTKHDGEIIEQNDFSFNRKLYELSTVSGYESLGNYQQVGSLTFDQDRISMIRFQKPMDIYRTPITLFNGDKIITGENQTADLNFLSKDDIKVSGSSEFVVDDYQKKADKISFIFKGKIRAKIKKRLKKGMIRFKTATALIGVKGTDFEAIASEVSSEVATVEGLVGVSDPSGAGEVDVAEGMMTTIAAGELPKEPIPIPPERFKQLKLTGVVSTAVVLTDLKNISLESETAYAKPILNFQTVPVDALFEVYLDQTLLENFKLNQMLNDLQDGKHQLEIKGFGEQPYVKSIQFIVDTKSPQVKTEEPQKSIWELTEKEPLKLTWDEMIASAEVTVAQTKIIGKIQEDKKSALFSFDSIPDFFKKAAEHKASVIAMDKAGNQQDQDIKLKILNPHQPKLSTDHQSTELRWTQSQDINIQSDQKIKSWIVKLEDKVLAFMNEKMDLVQDRSLKIPKQVLNDQPDGHYHLSIKAENAAGKSGELLLTIILDQTKPKVLKVVPKANLENLRLSVDSSIKIIFSEKIKRLEAKIKGEKWNLKPEPNGLSLIIKASKLIGDESQPYYIQFYDQSNHFGEIYGHIQNETKNKVIKTEVKVSQKVRNSSPLLKKAYLNTILLKSHTLLDQTILINRLPFYYNNSLISSDSMEILGESGIQFKHNNDWLKSK
ncbi:MAG: FecR domain-containing protein [Deltaproteobacteria bacterium]|jgi:hypothetical protein|nr:FecR domain-containing protein [Deltaproteobacteria bacterium]